MFGDPVREGAGGSLPGQERQATTLSDKSPAAWAGRHGVTGGGHVSCFFFFFFFFFFFIIIFFFSFSFFFFFFFFFFFLYDYDYYDYDNDYDYSHNHDYYDLNTMLDRMAADSTSSRMFTTTQSRS